MKASTSYKKDHAEMARIINSLLKMAKKNKDSENYEMRRCSDLLLDCAKDIKKEEMQTLKNFEYYKNIETKKAV